jgi:hypothetical protein
MIHARTWAAGPIVTLHAVAILWLTAPIGTANAFTIQSDNPDVGMRWDTQLRYNLGRRLEGRDPKIANNANFDESDFKFDRGDLINNRLDIFSEFDFAYRKQYGFRLSAAGWFDAAYDSEVKTSPAFAARSSYTNDRYSSFTKRFYRGPSGEILDAFVFGNWDFGESKAVRAKLGQHAIYWGESVFNANHSVAYSQAPVDGRKALTSPGIEAKETFLPIDQLSGQLQLSDDFALNGQYFFDWKPNRLPEGGTYFGGADFLFDGPDRFSAAPGLFLRRADAVVPDKRGNWGVNAKWSPSWLDGNLGLYYRRFDERQPFSPQINVGSRLYRLVYPRDTELIGISLGKNIGGVAVGAELVKRRNTAFNGTGVNPATLDGPRGDSYHAILNGTLLTNLGKWANTLTVVGELVWSRWDKVTSNPNLFKALGFPGCTTNDAIGDSCATKNYYGINLLVSPKWLQVYPGLDLSMPISVSYGLKGNAATLAGGNDGSGNYSIGLSFDYLSKYTFDIKYIDYLVKYRDNGTAATTVNGGPYSDRGLLALTFKTTF